MPDPRELKVGDRVRFVAIPDEWSQTNFQAPFEDRLFMKAMINRKFGSRVCGIDEQGFPWIQARFQVRGIWVWHSWTITETTGWRKVEMQRSE